jgi:hypothetical protein
MLVDQVTALGCAVATTVIKVKIANKKRFM